MRTDNRTEKCRTEYFKSFDRNASQGPCCEELLIRRYYRRFHRFFLFSPLLLLTLFLMMLSFSRSSAPSQASVFMMILFALIFAKELVGFMISRKIYLNVLLPVEELKQGVHAVAQGRYGVSVRPASLPEIDDLIQAFNAMSARLEESERETQRYETNRKELLANISHDLKTPITSINGFVDGILDGVAAEPERQETYMRIIQQNARYMNRLVDDLILYSKLDIHKLEFQFQPLDMGQYIRELFQELQLENEEYGIAMGLDSLPEGKATVNLDGRHMTRAIRNLVSNARIHGNNPNLHIDFQLTRTPSHLSLIISDNGPGIPENKLPFVFERFFKADDARTAECSGSGLGLAISREIIAAHGGTIAATNLPTGGAAMTITLPIAKEAAAHA